MAKRPVLESGEAYKIVYVSKAPADMKFDELDKAVSGHQRLLRRELQRQGKLVKRCYRLLHDMEVKLVAEWQVLGDKPGRKSAIARAKEKARNVNRFVYVPKKRVEIADNATTDVEEDSGQSPAL